MQKHGLRGMLIGLVVIGFGSLGYADYPPEVSGLRIDEVQYSEDPIGTSPHHQSFVDTMGGIVTHIEGFRIYLQDPNEMDGWGAICIKDFSLDGALGDLQAGDWVGLTDVYVYEKRETTFLEYEEKWDNTDPENPVRLNPNLGFVVGTSDDPVPTPVGLTAADLAAPIEDPVDFWNVVDRHSEPYESMIVTLQDVTVGAMGLGKADDNYVLSDGTGSAWASDYLQTPEGWPDEPYFDPRIETGLHLDSVTGIVEQYYKQRDTYGWDYYQLLTRTPDDIVVPEPGTVSLLLVGLVLAGRRRRAAQLDR